MASRDLNLLVPELREIAFSFQKEMWLKKVDFVFSCTERSFAEQTALYAQGRVKAGKIVTNAPAGESAHNWGCAFDIAVFDCGKYASDHFDGWKIAGKIGTDLGLEWLGSPNSKFPELAHFQLFNWRLKYYDKEKIKSRK